MKKLNFILVGCSLFLFHSVAIAKLNIFACESEWGSLMQELVSDNASIFTATTAKQDPHHIQARPSLIAKMRKADLVVCSGSDLEVGWLPLLLRSSANDRVQVNQPGYVETSQLVERLEVPQQVDRAMGDVHVAGNPHVHLDPRRIAVIAQKLSERLAMLDAAHAQDYQKNTEAFLQRWQKKTEEWTAQAAPLAGIKVVVHHKDWVYLFDWLGIEEVSTLEPKPGVPPSAGHLAQLKQQMEHTPAKLVIYTAYQDGSAANWLQKNAGIPALELPFTVGGSDKATDLFTLMDDTIEKLLGALK